jgi:hypothetical protein
MALPGAAFIRPLFRGNPKSPTSVQNPAFLPESEDRWKLLNGPGDTGVTPHQNRKPGVAIFGRSGSKPGGVL